MTDKIPTPPHRSAAEFPVREKARFPVSGYTLTATAVHFLRLRFGYLEYCL